MLQNKLQKLQNSYEKVTNSPKSQKVTTGMCACVVVASTSFIQSMRSLAPTTGEECAISGIGNVAQTRAHFRKWQLFFAIVDFGSAIVDFGPLSTLVVTDINCCAPYFRHLSGVPFGTKQPLP